MSLIRSGKRARAARQRAQRPPTATATITLPLDVLRVLYALQQARNLGHDEVLVRVKTWRVQIDDQS